MTDRCAQAPLDPEDGDRLTCERCGYSAEFVVLNDERTGEWVEMTGVSRD